MRCEETFFQIYKRAPDGVFFCPYRILFFKTLLSAAIKAFFYDIFLEKRGFADLIAIISLIAIPDIRSVSFLEPPHDAGGFVVQKQGVFHIGNTP